jgi:hypothetical protein
MEAGTLWGGSKGRQQGAAAAQDIVFDLLRGAGGRGGARLERAQRIPVDFDPTAINHIRSY